MSRRSRTQQGPAAASNRGGIAATEVDGDDAARLGERLRRIALGLTAALIVARAYWDSEGTSEVESAEGLGWTFALLWTATLGLAGAFLSRTLSFRISWADVAVVALFGLVGMSTSQALDRRIAINLAWQWGGVGIAYVLLRTLPRTARESRDVAGALAATAVALSVYAFYQLGVELPELRRRFLENPRAMLTLLGVDAEPGSAEYMLFENRILHSTEPFSTFGLSNSLAGYLVGPLVLWLSIMVSAVAGRSMVKGSDRRLGIRWGALGLATIPAVGVLIILLLTKSRSAYLGLIVGGAVVGVALAPRVGRKRLVLGALAAMGVGIGASTILWRLGYLDREVLTQSSLSLRYRFEWWVGTWRLLTSGGTWLTGLGPGNFRFAYRRAKLPESSEDIADPHNLFLEVWEVAGIFALLALVLGLGLIVWNLLTPRREPSPMEPNEPEGSTRIVLWAGLGGWLLAAGFGQMDLLAEGNGGLIRWLLLGGGWGLAVLLGGRLWKSTAMPVAGLGAAVLAVVVNLLAAGGIGYATVASMLWAIAAIGLNLRVDRPSGRLRTLEGLLPPFTAGAVLAALIGMFFGAIGPVWRVQSTMSRADAILGSRAASPRQEDLDRVARLLDAAIAADAYATRPYLALAELELLAWLGRGAPPEDAVWERTEAIYAEARTRPRNPLSLDVCRSRIATARRILDSRPDLPSKARERLQEIIAAASYTIATHLTPTSAIDRARAAIALAGIGDWERAIVQAERALELDAITPHLDKKLPGAIRDHLRLSLDPWRSRLDD